MRCACPTCLSPPHYSNSVEALKAQLDAIRDDAAHTLTAAHAARVKAVDAREQELVVNASQLKAGLALCGQRWDRGVRRDVAAIAALCRPTAGPVCSPILAVAVDVHAVTEMLKTSIAVQTGAGKTTGRGAGLYLFSPSLQACDAALPGEFEGEEFPSSSDSEAFSLTGSESEGDDEEGEADDALGARVPLAFSARPGHIVLELRDDEGAAIRCATCDDVSLVSEPPGVSFEVTATDPGVFHVVYSVPCAATADTVKLRLLAFGCPLASLPWSTAQGTACGPFKGDLLARHPLDKAPHGPMRVFGGWVASSLPGAVRVRPLVGGDSGADTVLFSSPSRAPPSLCFTPDGRLVVVDSVGGRVLELTLQGVVVQEYRVGDAQPDMVAANATHVAVVMAQRPGHQGDRVCARVCVYARDTGEKCGELRDASLQDALLGFVALSPTGQLVLYEAECGHWRAFTATGDYVRQLRPPRQS